MRIASVVSFTLFLATACSSKPNDGPQPAPTNTQVAFDLSADFAKESAFFDFPWPSDLRLVDGAPIASGFPNPLGKKLVEGVRRATGHRKGFPVMPTAYFHFDAPLAARDVHSVVAADPSSPILLIDVDESSPERGRLFPVVANVLVSDDYVPANVLGVAARPGFVLTGRRKYAFVVKRSLADSAGKPLAVPPALAELAAGRVPAGARGNEAKSLYAPLFATLSTKGIAATDVAAATVFTTGDVVADFAAMSDKVLAAHEAKITELAIDPDDGAAHPRYCELRGKMTVPQFQPGKPPFDDQGLFEMEGDVPKKQRDESIPITVNFPKGTMPKGGWPLLLYFHGSGGLSTASVDRGTWRVESDVSKCPEKSTDEWEGKKGCNTKGEGPAHVVAAHGIGSAGAAFPVNPERLPGASSIAYINLGNLAAMRDTFRQGALEQRLFLAALKKLTVAPEVVAGCSGMALPADESAHHFKTDTVVAMGQSMGGMYTNIIASIEPSIKVVAPTGAGGYWSYFITRTSLFDDGAGLVAGLVGAAPGLDFMHPMLTMLEVAIEPSDPMAYMPRLAYRPLPGHPARSIYEPVGKGDSFFPIELYDAIALAYGHPQTGDVVWPSMQEALKLGTLDGLRPYPITQNLKSANGSSFTGAVVQYEGDGLYDPHAIYTQRPEVKYQYGCFFASFLKTGTATIFKPGSLDAPCP